MKYTPGPWKYHKDQQGRALWKEVTNVSGEFVCLLSHHPKKQKIAEANARLIASTPDLLKALKEAIDVAKDTSILPTIYEKWENIIKKAEGK